MEEKMVKSLLCTSLREKPETKRASRKLGNIDFSKLIHMGLNENEFGMSPKAVEAMNAVAADGNYYGDWTQKDFKGAIADRFGVDPSFIVTGCGSSALTDALGTAFLEKGDEVVLCMPTFPAIIDTAQTNGATPVIVPTTEDLKLDMDGMLAKINEHTKMVYICNPNNPTGTYIGYSKLREFAEKCPDHVIQVYDEAYIEFSKSADCLEMVETMKELKDKPIVVLKTMSKCFGMAGVRAGYILAQPEMIVELAKCGTQFALNKMAQAGAAAALRDSEHLAKVKALNAASREYLETELEKLGCKVYSSETNFIFFDPHVEPTEVFMKMMERGIFMSAQAGANRVSTSTMENCQLFIKNLTEI
nr:histidinol-phosphate aminotransferase family protein [Lachnospiraceae bacterium]